MILVSIPEKEKLKTIAIIRQFKKKPVVSISMIAKAANINSGRMRFIVEILVDEGRIKKIPVKIVNDRYKRYRYEEV